MKKENTGGMMIQLNKLVLENTGIHDYTEIDFGKVTVIEAKNARGKTTVENAIIALVEGKYKDLVSNEKTDGKITGFFSDNISMSLPLKAGAKSSPTIVKDGSVMNRPRTFFDEWISKSLKVSNFFDGKGADLEKKQVETLLSIIKIKLDESEVKEICGNLPLEQQFKTLHPLEYIKALVNEKDGYFYTERAKNTAQIQTTNHSMLALRDSVIEVFNKYGISIDTFNTEEWQSISLSEKAVKLHETEKQNNIHDEYAKFIVNYDEHLRTIEALNESELNQLKREVQSKTEQETNSLHKSLCENCLTKLNILGDVRTNSIDEFHDSIHRKLDEMKAIVDRWHDESSERVVRITDKHDWMFEALKEKSEGRIAEAKSKKEIAEKYLAENSIISIESMIAENEKIEAIQKIIPTYKEFKRMESEYTTRKELSEEYNEIIGKLRALPKQLLQRAEMPVKNLSITEDGKFVYKNIHGKGVFLDQLSGWEKIQVSYDVAIASMGEINLLIISDWSEIDRDNQETTINYFIERGINLLAIGISNDEKLKITKYNEVIK